jgi:fatty-acyl-CoA synthase
VPILATRFGEALRRIGPMGQLFGQTEAPMMISTMAPKDHYDGSGAIATQRLSSAGRVSPLVQLAIVSAEGEHLPNGERGEIVVRGSLVMKGYYRNPQATAEASVNGWHRTGDIGYLDEDNYLYIVDRAKDMIITGGFNVYSIEVEQALAAHEAVLDCAVIGLPDEKWGERIVAVVQAKSGATIDANELVAFIKARIGSVKTPKQIEVWPDLPRSKVGKVLKAEIKFEILSGAPKA